MSKLLERRIYEWIKLGKCLLLHGSKSFHSSPIWNRNYKSRMWFCLLLQVSKDSILACHHKEQTHIEDYYQQVAVENISIWKNEQKVGENLITRGLTSCVFRQILLGQSNHEESQIQRWHTPTVKYMIICGIIPDLLRLIYKSPVLASREKQ